MIIIGGGRNRGDRNRQGRSRSGVVPSGNREPAHHHTVNTAPISNETQPETSQSWKELIHHNEQKREKKPGKKPVPAGISNVAEPKREESFFKKNKREFYEQKNAGKKRSKKRFGGW